MGAASGDHLLTAVLAVQLGFASPAQVVAAAAAWVSDRSRSLADRLEAEGVLTAERRRMLDMMVAEAVKAHGGDVDRTMASFGGDAVLQQSFAGSLVLEADGQVRLVDQSTAEEGPDTIRQESGEGEEVITPEAAGRYQLSGEHGRGGQARVMLAADTHIGRDVAWKELLPGRAGSQASATGISRASSAMNRFLREARITGQLEHPNIVPVYEVGRRADGQVYYTMRLVRGQTLAKALAACGSLADRMRLLEHFVDMCQAIAYAHSRGVIHRDIKPENVMVGQFGETVLLDWGLAKMRGIEDVRGGDLEKQMQLLHQWSTGDTVDGSALGTPSYMSPEQAEGLVDQIDERSDVWGLGAVLYEILTGRPPYTGETPFEIVGKVLREPVPQVLNACPDAPAELAAVASKALRQVKELRYPSARELAADVSAYLTGGRVSAFAYSGWDLFRRFARRHKAAMAAASLVLLVVLSALVVVSVAYQRQSEAREREQAARQEEQKSLRLARYRLAQAYVEKAERMIADGRFMAGRIFAAASLQHNPARPGAPLYDRDFVAQRSDAADLLVTAGSRIYQTNHALKARLERVFEVDETGLRLAISRSGQRLATMLHDGQVVVWQVDEGRELLRFKAHKKGGYHLAFTPDGRGLATVGREGAVKVWNLGGTAGAGPTERFDLAGHENDVITVAMAPDGLTLATGGVDKTIRLWDLTTGQPRATLTGHTGTVWTLAFSPDGARLASGSWDKTIRIWDVAAGTQVRALDGQPDAVYGVAYTPDGRHLVAGTYDGELRLWDTTSWEVARRLPGNADAIYDVAVSADGQLIGTAGFDRTFRLFHRDSGQLLFTLSGHQDAVGAIVFSADGRHFATAGSDRTIRLWTLDRADLLPTLDGHTDWVYDVAYSADGRQLASVAWDRQVRLWDLAHGGACRVLGEHKAGLFAVDISGDGKRIASADVEGTVRLWDAPTGALLREWQAHPLWVYKAHFSPDGKRLITASRDRTAAIWDVATGQRMLVLDGHTDFVHQALFSSDGRRVLTVARDYTARIWDAQTGKSLHVLRGHRDWVSGGDFSPDGRLLATSGKDAQIILWDARTGKELRRFRRHKQWVNSVHFSSDGRLLASASDDATVVLWDVASGQALLEIAASNSVSCADFSPDGGVLAVGDRYSIKLYPLNFSLAELEAGKVIEQVERDSGLTLSGFELHPARGQGGSP